MRNFVTKKVKSNLKFVYSQNNTVSIIFSKNEDLLGVVGEFNNNIKELEKITDTSIYSRGNSIILKNDAKKNEIIKNAVSFLYDQYIINGSIEKKDIIIKQKTKKSIFIKFISNPIKIRKSGRILKGNINSSIFVSLVIKEITGINEAMPIPSNNAVAEIAMNNKNRFGILFSKRIIFILLI